MNSDSGLEHRGFLDLSGDDPSLPFAKSLIEFCGEKGAIFVYNIGFESSRIKELADRFPKLTDKLIQINNRLVDLWPIAKEHYYHPIQEGSWSIKKVLPAVAPHLNYNDLEGVKDGGMAMDAFELAISTDITTDKKAELERQLLKYCEMDTLAMVELFNFFKNGKNFAS